MKNRKLINDQKFWTSATIAIIVIWFILSILSIVIMWHFIAKFW